MDSTADFTTVCTECRIEGGMKFAISTFCAKQTPRVRFLLFFCGNCMREEKTLDDDFELSLSFSLSLAFEARTFNHATLLVERILRSFFLVSQSTQQKGRLMTFACVRVFRSFFLKRLLFRVFDGKKFKNFQKPSRRLTSSSEEVFGHARIHHPHSRRR